jgi:hypothetical protein
VQQLIRGEDNIYADLNTVFIDTSKSNLHNKISEEQVYLIDGVDGSGQVRKENHAVISERVRDILQTFKPVDLNLVLSSLSGGTGSVVAPLLASELLAKGLPTIVIGVGDDSTRKFAENTLNTLKSYEHIAKLRRAPIVMFYIQNSADMPRAVVDQRIQELVAALMLLFSRRNRELDSKDLFNWINYHTVTTHEPGLAALSLFDKIDTSRMSALGNLISIATLVTDALDPSLPIRPEVQYVGYVEGTLNGQPLATPYHYVTSDGVFVDVAANLNGVLRELDEQSQARLKKTSISTNADQATDSGLIL